MYILTVYTHDDCFVYRCKTFKECVRTVSSLTDIYVIIGLDIHKVPKTEIRIKGA